MHVHLVAIEVGVIGRADRRIEPEGLVGHYLHPVGHDGHPVQGWLAVEQDYIAIGKLAVDLPADVDLLCDLLTVLVCDLDPPLVGTGDVIDSRVPVRTAAHKCLHYLHVPGVGNHGHR